jgi:hypothetical protein
VLKKGRAQLSGSAVKTEHAQAVDGRRWLADRQENKSTRSAKLKLHVAPKAAPQRQAQRAKDRKTQNEDNAA